MAARLESLLSSVVVVALFVLGVWFVGGMLGFHIALWQTLIASVVLTVVLNLVVTALRS